MPQGRQLEIFDEPRLRVDQPPAKRNTITGGGGPGDHALTPKEIAALERLSPDAIYRSIAAGDLAARKVCGRLRVDRTDYEAWKGRHQVRARPQGPMFVPPAPGARDATGGSFLAELGCRRGKERSWGGLRR
jgi:hypothetical protein